MSFSVTVGSDTFEIYAGLPATKSYINGKRTDAAQSFRDLSDDDQARTLNDVTLFLDRQAWQGTAKLVGTTLQFPRSGLLDSTGAVIDDATQLAAIARAVGELCAIAADDEDALESADTSANIRRADAGGGTGVEFFNPTTTLGGTATTLPTPAQQLLGQWLLGDSDATTGPRGQSGGSCGFVPRRFDRDRPF